MTDILLLCILALIALPYFELPRPFPLIITLVLLLGASILFFRGGLI